MVTTMNIDRDTLSRLPPWAHIRAQLEKAFGIIWQGCEACLGRGHKDDRHCPECGGRRGWWARPLKHKSGTIRVG